MLVGNVMIERERLGREVRRVWIEWARQQPNPKPHWLTPWEEMSEPDREVDRRIGEQLASLGWNMAMTFFMTSPKPPPDDDTDMCTT